MSLFNLIPNKLLAGDTDYSLSSRLFFFIGNNENILLSLIGNSEVRSKILLAH